MNGQTWNIMKKFKMFQVYVIKSYSALGRIIYIVHRFKDQLGQKNYE